MMLNALENTLLGKMIGLLNGISEDEVDTNLILLIRKTLVACQNREDLTEYISLWTKAKTTYLPGCSTCKTPCGRTMDFSINDISNEKIKQEKIRQWKELLNKKIASLKVEEIFYNISSLGW